MRVSGKPVLGMCVTGVSAVTNIILDAVFVAVLDLGVTGAAWATVIGQILSALFGTYLVLKGYTKVEIKKETFSFNFELSKKIISCGFAFWIAQMAMGLISLVYNSQLGKYGGDTAISVYAVVASIMTFVIMPASGISQGIQPIVGNNFGAGNYKRVMATLYQASAFSVGVTCVIWFIVMFFPEALLLAFGASEEMLEIGVAGLRTNFCITPILGFVMLVTTFFQSIAKPIPSIVITFLRQILLMSTRWCRLPSTLSGLDTTIFSMNSWTILGVSSVSRVTCLARWMNFCKSSALSAVAFKLASNSGISAFNCFCSFSSDTVSVANRSSDNRPLAMSS